MAVLSPAILDAAANHNTFSLSHTNTHFKRQGAVLIPNQS